MSEGFETKSADAAKNSLNQRKSAEVADIGSIQKDLVEQFALIKDPRVERTKKHQLADILVIAVLAVIAGAQGWEDIENYGISKQQWLEEFLELANGIFSDDTFRRVFEFIDPEALNRCFSKSNMTFYRCISFYLRVSRLKINADRLMDSRDKSRKQCQTP